MFPSSTTSNGGTDLSKFRTGFSHITTGSITYETALSIQGTGILVSAYQYTGGTSNGGLRVTIDGTVVFDEGSFSASSSGTPTIKPYLTFMYKFTQSLLIEHFSGVTTTRTCVSYLIA